MTTLLVCTCTHPPLCTFLLDGELQLIRNERETKLLNTGFTRALSRYRSAEGTHGGMMPFTQYVLSAERMDFPWFLDEAAYSFGVFFPIKFQLLVKLLGNVAEMNIHFQ